MNDEEQSLLVDDKEPLVMNDEFFKVIDWCMRMNEEKTPRKTIEKSCDYTLFY